MAEDGSEEQEDLEGWAGIVWTGRKAAHGGEREAASGRKAGR